MITIKEIARQAEVSTTTVSNVLHGKANKVSPETLKKIRELLKENNYIPRFGLNALTSKESKIIGILINTPDFLETPYDKPFYGIIISVLEQLFRECGYYCMVFSSKDVDEIMRMMLGWNVDGIVAVSVPKKYCQKIEEMTGKTLVAIDMDVNDLKETKDSYHVTSPDYESGEMMVDYLAGKQVTEIVYVANVKRGADYRRYKGAAAAYKRHYGKDQELALIILGRSFELRQQQYRELERLKGSRAAVFFSTDLNAVEAIGCFTRAGIRIPDDISVVGVDDEAIARLCVPRLTTIRSDASEKARLAAGMMLTVLQNHPVTDKSKLIEVEIIERESVIGGTLGNAYE